MESLFKLTRPNEKYNPDTQTDRTFVTSIDYSLNLDGTITRTFNYHGLDSFSKTFSRHNHDDYPRLKAYLIKEMPTQLIDAWKDVILAQKHLAEAQNNLQAVKSKLDQAAKLDAIFQLSWDVDRLTGDE